MERNRDIYKQKWINVNVQVQCMYVLWRMDVPRHLFYTFLQAQSFPYYGRLKELSYMSQIRIHPRIWGKKKGKLVSTLCFWRCIHRSLAYPFIWTIKRKPMVFRLFMLSVYRAMGCSYQGFYPLHPESTRNFLAKPPFQYSLLWVDTVKDVRPLL